MLMPIKLQIKPSAAKLFQKGFPLVERESVANPDVLKEEGEIFTLVDSKGSMIGTGYYGKQNKGIGWILSFKKEESIDQSFFNQKIKAASDQRTSFFNSSETTAFRLFNGEGDGIGGLTVDYFDGYCLINWYSKGIYAFKESIIAALQKTVSPKGIYQKKRFDEKGQYIEEDDFVAGEQAPYPLLVKENGASFAVYLNEGAMVGVFLDQRDVRKAIRDTYANGKTVLNMFSYTGAFSVFAALGGAVKTVSVDVANRSLPKTIEQFSINGIDHEAQEIIVEDVFKYFKYAARKEKTYDLVILDPPSFAKSKKHTFSAAKDYKNLLKDTISLTANNGVIVASTNASNVSDEKFKGFIDQAFKETGISYSLLENYHLPEDFRTIPQYKQGNYLKVYFIKVKKKRNGQA
ncbi:class I SAM-dependent rRNA methyltransferase [Bacillus sp. FJAT-42376]|uniref:class I SAM-dependent rRNA methyltransferase n=1 Tax=Bacillus sp. FJAT-42376 TaxID=2014076 RepID=UPI000F4EF24F|nr:class I SAM-dependent rRNA methyltransferase [Bacillus sp. FJAT-42376]AZB44691.1 class I SAM-dependent rRNA methyltransferase [Bacillus sp. FJAT-42376]